MASVAPTSARTEPCGRLATSSHLTRAALSPTPPARGTLSRRAVIRTGDISFATGRDAVSLAARNRFAGPGAARRDIRRCQVPRSSSNGTTQALPDASGCVIVIDNYDSFTYNLCQYLGDLGCKYIVFKNDEYTVEQIRGMRPAGILVSPGPGRPEDSGISLEIIEKLGPEGIPTFGVCMGHQCIGQVFGGDIIRAPCGVMHGKSSPVFHTDVGLLEGLPNPFKAARYHSLVIDKDSCPEDIEVTAWTEDGTIMACRHKKYPHIQGVQFHPESVITEDGMSIVGNFLKTLTQTVAA